MTTKNLIIGSGLTGILVAQCLKERAEDFLVLERSERAGGRSLFMEARIFSEETTEFLKRFGKDLDFSQREISPKLKKKKDWVAAGDEFSDSESIYVRPTFIAPNLSAEHFVELLSKGITEQVILKKHAAELNVKERNLLCTDGSEYSFERLFWCAGLDSLLKLNKELGKGIPNLNQQAGLVLEWATSEPLFPIPNTMVIPFNFKEHKLRTLGVSKEENITQWLLFLPEEIAENKEETAKCIRTWKRELAGEFESTITQNRILNEKIISVPISVPEKAFALESLELAPWIFYVGSEARTTKSNKATANIDLVVQNLKTLFPVSAQ